MHGLSARCRDPRKVHLFREGQPICGSRSRYPRCDSERTWKLMPEHRCARCIRISESAHIDTAPKEMLTALRDQDAQFYADAHRAFRSVMPSKRDNHR